MTSTENLALTGSAAGGQDNLEDRLVIYGRWIRTARPVSETFNPIESPDPFLSWLRDHPGSADLFTFAQRFSEPTPRYTHHCELEPVAILKLGAYQDWWKKTINDKTRNMVRKAGKKGVQIELAPYTDDLVQGIKQIYDECPVRQGKRSRHYGKSIETIKREHGTFLDRSEFIAARFDNRLIGFAKVVFQKDFASIMNLIALLSERDKAPTNALLAKAVERCADKGIGLLHYGMWSRRGFGDFKQNHGFVCESVPRFYVPVTPKGALALRLGLHRPLAERLPTPLLDWIADQRTRWYGWRYPIK